MDIRDKLKEVAQIRLLVDFSAIKADILQKGMESTPEWIEYKSEVKILRDLEQKEAALLDEIRIMVVAQFDGVNKKPFKGIEIKEFSVVKVLDEKKALVWASQNAPSTLKLDQTKFKKAVENLELDFVEKSVEYRGQIASDLSEYLK